MTITHSAPTEPAIPFFEPGPTTTVAPGSASEELTPIDLYLRSQQQLTPVESFAKQHDADLLPAQERYYRDLIPATKPGAGQQYAFEVDLDACSGCKACVAACHRLNGLDDGEAFRSVGTLIGTEPSVAEDVVGLAWQQTVTTACHHCLDPACLNGCPVDAYEKDPFTGIVRHLDDQCIGCSYCTLTCPYEVPTFNADRGIVRKCDLCQDRLADGEAPACVQACPTSAISVGIVDVAELTASIAEADDALVPTAPRSQLTQPTTRYRSTRPLPDGALPADHFSVRPGHAHPPLTVMLVLTQLAVGAFVADLVVHRFASPNLAAAMRSFDAFASLGVGLLAMGASLLHLGRPQYAWRAVIGLRHSWLSREILAFSAFAVCASAYALGLVLGLPDAISGALGGLAAAAGIAGVGCSIMVYAATGKAWWRVSTSTYKFGLTAAICGPALLAPVAAIAAFAGGDAAALTTVTPLLGTVLVATAVKLLAELSLFTHLHDRTYTERKRTAMLLRDDLRRVTGVRFIAGLTGGILLPLLTVACWTQPAPPVLPSIGLPVLMLVLVVVAELAERWTFFTAVASPRMPGGLR